MNWIKRLKEAEMNSLANGGITCRSCGKSMAAVKELCDDCQKKGRKSDNPDDPAYYANRAAIQARNE